MAVFCGVSKKEVIVPVVKSDAITVIPVVSLAIGYIFPLSIAYNSY